jgi:hypothetical protein
MLMLGQALLLLMPGPGRAQGPYEAYYLYLGNYPDEANPGWHENAQGLAHDRDNWFITQTRTLWKVPVTQDLNRVRPSDPSVIVKELNATDMPELDREGYDHLGDPAYYEYKGQGFVLVPVEGGSRPALAVFRADTLQYIAHDAFFAQSKAGWCAVDPAENVYSSDSSAVAINQYTVPWDNPRFFNTLRLSNVNQIFLRDENGIFITAPGIEHMQGGEISPSGQLLYLVAGFYDQLRPTDGIHVFDLSTRRRIQRSTNGFGHFNYEFHQGGFVDEEPEGLTIWDLDNDPRVPDDRLRGQLHVILLDNDSLDADDVYVKHYTQTIYVDRTYTGEEHGRPRQPFNTLREANNLAWDGARINIKAGAYAETLTFSKRTELVASGGTVTIGR